MTGDVLAQMAQPLEQWQVEEARAREKEERENLERRCSPLGVIASSKIMPKATYLLTEAAEKTAEIVLTGLTGLAVIEVRAREDWVRVVENHLDTLRAMLSLGRIDAIHAENGSRVKVTANHPTWSLTELAITRSDFEKFARVVGIEFERNTNKDVHSGQGQYDTMINIIGALYQLAAANKQAGQVRGIASNVAKRVSQRTGVSIDPKTVRRYLKEVKDRGFSVEDEDSRESDEPA